MCGVPHHAWQLYVGKLLRAGHKVVICDQVEAASKNKIVKRDVTRVLTPGTVVEDAYLEPSRPNYLVAAWTRGLSQASPHARFPPASCCSASCRRTGSSPSSRDSRRPSCWHLLTSRSIDSTLS